MKKNKKRIVEKREKSVFRRVRKKDTRQRQIAPWNIDFGFLSPFSPFARWCTVNIIFARVHLPFEIEFERV